VALDLPPEMLPTLRATLTSDERKRADRFLRSWDQTRFLVAHAALRDILSNYLGAPPKCCRFGYMPHGKPILTYPPKDGLEFNLSHSDGLALVAVARGRAVGVDVEAIQPQLDYRGVAQMVFSEADQNEIRALPERERLDAFFVRWTRNEANLKCVGTGFSGSSETVTSRCFTTSFRPAPGYIAAIAVDGHPSNLCGADWQSPLGGRVRPGSQRLVPPSTLRAQAGRAMQMLQPAVWTDARRASEENET
jgi:4'-phosphopantetheinyl transferase